MGSLARLSALGHRQAWPLMILCGAVGFGLTVFFGLAVPVLGLALAALGLFQRKQAQDTSNMFLVIGVSLMVGSALYFTAGTVLALTSSAPPDSGFGTATR